MFILVKVQTLDCLGIVQVKVVDWMRGQTCGLCGKADGEVRQEYRAPNERLVKDAASYAHSWVIPGKSCRDASGNTHLLSLLHKCEPGNSCLNIFTDCSKCVTHIYKTYFFNCSQSAA